MIPGYLIGKGQIHGLFRSLLFCIGVQLWFKYVQDDDSVLLTKKAKATKFNAGRCIPGYRTNKLSPASLIEEFQKHPCCQENCIVRKVGLSAPGEKYCSSCHPGGFCGSSTSCKSHVKDLAQQVEFMELVEANRAAYDPYRALPGDSKAVKKDKKYNMKASLIGHFRKFGKSLGGNYDWKEGYYVKDSAMESIYVCKEAWCAIMGVKVGGLEYIQDLVRAGEVPNADADGIHERIDVSKAFLHCGINVDTYHYYIGAFCVISAIPQTEASLVAAAWLSDYFELVGEAQPNVLAIHYDPISIAEIHEEYMNDPFVHDLINGDDTNKLQYAAFNALIRDVFPRVRPREYKSVSGKKSIQPPSSIVPASSDP